MYCLCTSPQARDEVKKYRVQRPWNMRGDKWERVDLEKSFRPALTRAVRRTIA